MSYEEFDKACDDLLSKYSNLQLGKLKDIIQTAEISQGFINILNIFAHDNGKNLLKKDLVFALGNFQKIPQDNFE
jgi:hypothetical protein